MVLNRTSEEGFSGKVVFGKKPEGGKEVNHVEMWESTFQLENLKGKQAGRCVAQQGGQHGWGGARAD